MGLLILIGILSFITVLCFRAATVKKPIVLKSAQQTVPEINVDSVAARLSQFIQEATISNTEVSKTDWKPYKTFMELLATSYPLVHQHAEREIVNDYSMIYRFKGQNPDLKPVLIIAHYDVVPVEKTTESEWEYPPFKGVIADGFVWGRGTMDMKLHLISSLETMEMLIEEGFRPQRDIYLAFGHDEEIFGDQGALSIAKIFEDRGLEFDFVLDEGGFVIQDGFPLLKKPLAVVGIAEKGVTSIRITVESTGGHASMPPRNTSVGLLSRIITDLERKQFKMRICGPVREQFERIGSETPFPFRLLTANLWFFGPLFRKLVSRTNSGNAMLRTTTAATMFEGSMAHNVLPPKASAVVNFRLLQGETVEDVINHIKKVAKTENISIEPIIANEPSVVSSSDSDGFKRIENTIHQVFPGVMVSPYLVVGGTDARRYEKVCSNIYRFSPLLIEQADTGRLHNVNERISLENIGKSVQFFYRLITTL